MKKIAMGVEYDGSRYAGWQFQDGVTTVQQVVEQAVSKVAAQSVRVICAGRTDAGVHARCQVIHFETSAVRDERAWVLGSNVNLPGDVVILWAREVPLDFHARFAATRRSYEYIIYNRWVRPGLLRKRVSWVHSPLDAAQMALAARYLVGEHDFSAFRASSCQAKHAQREILALEVHRRGDLVTIQVTANAFLHHMVRNIAGALISVGSGEHKPEWIGQVLRGKDRTKSGVTAVPHGLYLTQVSYPEQFAIPSQLDSGFGGFQILC